MSGICYASFSVGRNRSNSPARSTRARMDEASQLLNTIPQHEHAAARRAGESYCVRFIGADAVPTLYRGTVPADSRYAGIPSAEIERARAKVRAVVAAASKPRTDALAKVARYKQYAREAAEC